MSSRLPLALVALVPATALLAACNPPASANGTGMNLMSLDLGIGGDLAAVLAAAPADQPAKADALWAQKDTASFAGRAGTIADAVKRRNPQVLGVQSAMQWSHAAPGAGAPALVEDYLDVLVSALAARGLSYTAAVKATTADLTLTGAAGDVYRVTDREAILVRADVAASSPTSGTFAAQRAITIGGAATTYPRGWASVHVAIGGKAFRVVSTHLDDVDRATQGAQGSELASVAGTGPVVVMGGLGADADNTAWAAYATLSSPNAFLYDAVASAGAAFPTCCRDPALVDPNAVLNRRYDVILTSPEFMVWSGARELWNGSAMVDGVWASGHGGIIAGVYLQ